MSAQYSNFEVCYYEITETYLRVKETSQEDS